MKITSTFDYDKPVKKENPGSYQWWYFDGADDSGDWHFVVIFYEGCPFSPEYNRRWEEKPALALAEKHPGITISIYYKGKPVYYSMSEYPEKDCAFDADKMKIRIGENTLEMKVHDGLISHHINLYEKLPGGDEVSGEMIFQGPVPNEGLFGDQENGETKKDHGWNLTIPKAKFSSNVEINSVSDGRKKGRFSGIGYHDHNIGSEPMKNEFDDWYWGRLHFKSGTLVYYMMQVAGKMDYRAWLIKPDGSEVLDEFTGGSLQETGTNFFMLNCARKISLSSPSGNKVEIQNRAVLDSGPFYYRFLSDAMIVFKSTESIETCTGISEYIQPSRIHQRLFWPLVRMRYRYVNRPHWVQKNPALYRWTW